MSPKIRKKIERRKRRIARRLDKDDNRGCDRPMMTATNIHYEIAGRTQATAAGGIGAFHLLVRKLGLDEAIDRRLGVLKIHLPYHDSDHVLNIAYNLLAGGRCLEHLELRPMTRPTSTPWAPAAFPTPLRPATSAAASTRHASTAYSKSSMPYGRRCGGNSPRSSSKRPLSTATA